MLAEHGFVADAAITLRTGVRAILRPIADDRSGMDAAAAPDCRMSEDVDMSRDYGVGPDAHGTFNHGIRTDADRGIELSRGINNSGRMDRQINIRVR